MTEAKFTLAIGGLSHDQAFEEMARIEDHLALDALAVTINETDEASAIWETVAWFATLAEAEQARQLLNVNAAIAPVPEKDWVRESLLGLSPVKAGRFYLHGSHDRDIRRHGGISLEIDAGTAFGTGHHGTTAGCLSAFDDILKRNRPSRILDLGTGTGVLAIAANKALKVQTLATDIDAEAIRVTKLNAALNGVGPLLLGITAAGLHHPNIRAGAPYDLIFANILARPLASLAPGLCTILQPGGHLILSGLTVDQLRWIKACYINRGLRPTRVIRNANWIALVMTKSKSRLSQRLSQNLKGLGYAQDV